jgi:hypothetical protein
MDEKTNILHIRAPIEYRDCPSTIEIDGVEIKCKYMISGMILINRASYNWKDSIENAIEDKYTVLHKKVRYMYVKIK